MNSVNGTHTAISTSSPTSKMELEEMGNTTNRKSVEQFGRHKKTLLDTIEGYRNSSRTIVDRSGQLIEEIGESGNFSLEKIAFLTRLIESGSKAVDLQGNIATQVGEISKRTNEIAMSALQEEGVLINSSMLEEERLNQEQSRLLINSSTRKTVDSGNTAKK